VPTLGTNEVFFIKVFGGGEKGFPPKKSCRSNSLGFPILKKEKRGRNRWGGTGAQPSHFPPPEQKGGFQGEAPFPIPKGKVDVVKGEKKPSEGDGFPFKPSFLVRK